MLFRSVSIEEKGKNSKIPVFQIGTKPKGIFLFKAVGLQVQRQTQPKPRQVHRDPARRSDQQQLKDPGPSEIHWNLGILEFYIYLSTTTIYMNTHFLRTLLSF